MRPSETLKLELVTLLQEERHLVPSSFFGDWISAFTYFCNTVEGILVVLSVFKPIVRCSLLNRKLS